MSTHANSSHSKINASISCLVVVCSVLLLAQDVLAYYPQSKNDRDGRTRDHFGEKKNHHRDQRPSHFRLPIQIQRFRTIDGTMNNPVGVNWGAAGVNLWRRVPADYSDGVSSPSGNSRQSARAISNLVCDQTDSIPNARQLSSMVWQWGQFLDHDISLTESHNPLEAFPIEVPIADQHFDPFGGGGQTIDLFRSHYRTNRPATEARNQINSITSWIDGSNVYGSDDETAMSLRTLTGGLMKTSDGDLLPRDESGFFLAGDVRANEQVGLTSMHTIFVREHNRIARRFAQIYPNLSDEQIYVRARQRVTGILQAITYNEFLPALMGDQGIRPYSGYSPTTYPNVSNLFSTAAYRFGHSMLNTEVWRINNDGSIHESGHLALRDAFFNPSNLTEVGVDPYLKGLAMQQAQEVDTKIVDDLRNFLFGGPGSGGFDLAALNIQRGRDHGLTDFNSVRKYYKLPAYNSFDEITADLQAQFALSEAYDSVDDIDPWVGILAEDHLPNASIGQTAFVIFRQQFEAIRNADRFWYQRDFRGRDLEVIHNTTLAQIIYRNSGVRNLQPNVFFAPTIQ
jgi:hypothetical protein